MADQRPAGVVLLAVLALAVAACSAGPANSATAPSSPAATVALSPPPQQLPLTGVDPCALLSAPQQAQLGLAAGAALPADAVFGDPQCSFRLLADPASFVEVQTISSRGVGYWLEPTLAVTVAPVTVDGFPALNITGSGTGDSQCSTAISVADGQMLVVDFGLQPSGTTTAQACARTERVGAAALTTLRTQE